MKNIYLSVVIPVFNEEKNIRLLSQEIAQSLSMIKKTYEIIFVDDGSTDNTLKELKKIKNINIVSFRKNFGQSAALDAGIKLAKGKIIISLDGDGQNDPADFKILLDKLNEEYDVVCGWRYKRKDSFSKRFISKGAKFLRKFFVDDGIHDSGCTLRAYKKNCFEDIDLYGEMHRMLPALLKWRGFKITEVKVNHRPRIHGKSKYNWQRVLKGFLDMIYIWFWRKYSTRPLHFFGGLGAILILLGSLLIIFLAYLRLFFNYSLTDKIWPLVGFFFLLIGIQVFIIGLLSASFIDTSHKKKYEIKEVLN